MRPDPRHASDDPDVVRRLIGEHPWATLVSGTDGGLVASQVPVLLDDEARGLSVVTHLGRPDEEIHALGEREVMLIVQGRHALPALLVDHRGADARPFAGGESPARGRGAHPT